MDTPPSYSLSLDEFLGPTPDIISIPSTFELHGLSIATFKYTIATVTDQRPTIIAIHGGPSCCHDMLLPLKLMVHEGYDVIFYDQAGCGFSNISTVITEPEKQAPWLLTIEYYLKELASLIEHYKLSDYYLYGNSWGTIICQEYAISKPKGLLGMVLDGALSDSQLYIQTQWRDRISTLPTFTQNIMKKCIETKDFSSPIYQEINDVLGRHFTCRTIPRPQVFQDSISKMNVAIYSKMQGECEFMIGGILKSYKITDKLYLVECPTLVLVGEYDTMTDECSMAIVNAIPKARPLVTIPRASHVKLLEEPFLVIQHVNQFLKSIVHT